MFDDVQHFQNQIIERDHPGFVSRYFFENVPFLFNDDIDGWIKWKTKLGNLIEVDPRNIVLTGSAAIGYSLNPHKNFRRFSNKSDIDCGVVSSYHFDLAWRYLRQQRVEWLTQPARVREAISIHRQNYIFEGTIATDKMLALLPFGRTWSSALQSMSKEQPTIGRDIKLRVYKDFEALRNYQMKGLRDAKAKLLEVALPAGNDNIQVEDN